MRVRRVARFLAFATLRPLTVPTRAHTVSQQSEEELRAGKVLRKSISSSKTMSFSEEELAKGGKVPRKSITFSEHGEGQVGPDTRPLVRST